MAEFTEIALAAGAFAEAQTFRDQAAAEVERRASYHTDAEARLAEALEVLDLAEQTYAAATATLQEITS